MSPTNVMSAVIEDLDTPVVLVDLAIVERNVARWQDYCNAHGILNRPHIKTHKLPRFAHLQVALGAAGIACQKLGEVRVMMDAGLDDIFMPYNVLGRAKLARLRELAGRGRVKVGCDSLEVAQALDGAFAGAVPLAVMVECDTGARRCGVQTPAAALDLAKAIEAMAGLRFAGLFTYPPAGGLASVEAFMSETRDRLAAAGIACETISSGGTPDMWRAHEAPSVTEHRAGTYIYNDLMQVRAGSATLEDCALTVAATVVSRPTPDRAILDAGSKTLTSDLGGLVGHGHILGYPDAVITKLSEEHGHVELGAGGPAPRVGEIVRIVPNHACPVSNLFDTVCLVGADGTMESVPVAARGTVR